MKRGLMFFVMFLGVMMYSCAISAGCPEPSKGALTPGTKVIAALAGPNWSVATIKSVAGKSYMVKYPDGGLGSLASAEVAAFPVAASGNDMMSCFAVGDKVLAKAHGDIWREATVRAIDGKTISVTFQDTTRTVVSMTEIVRYPR